jgi:FkbM family methyltransferase
MSNEFGMDQALRGLAQRGFRPSVIYDIGAADGGWALHALRHWPEAMVVCFEPLPERQGALKKLERQSGGQIKLMQCGLGDADGELEMGVTDDLWASSFAYAGSSTLTLPIRRLDSLLEQQRIPKPQFIKVDVQGYERRVLLGGQEAFGCAEAVILECQFLPFCAEMRTLDETIGDMSQRGFVPYEFIDFLRRPLDNAMGQCDLLFVRRDHELVADHRWGG